MATTGWSSDLDPASLGGDALTDLVMDVFQVNGSAGLLGIQEDTLRSFVAQVRDNYQDNAYHCFAHAVHVLLNSHRLLADLKDASTFTKEEHFALLFSALVHDLDHPGHTNMFEIESKSKLARMYNDQSVLEMHSISLSFELADRVALFANVAESVQRSLRKRIVEIVLATDIGPPSGRDRGILVKAKWDQAFAQGFSLSGEDQRMCVLVQLMRAADVGSAMQSYNIFANWSQRLYLENNKAVGLTQEGHTRTQEPFLAKYCLPLIKLIKMFPILKGDELMEDAVSNNLER